MWAAIVLVLLVLGGGLAIIVTLSVAPQRAAYLRALEQHTYQVERILGRVP